MKQRFVWLTVLVCAGCLASGQEEQHDEVAAQRVRSVITALNDAIEHEDVGAYMLRVDLYEPTFVTEQRAWIRGAIEHGFDDLRYDFLGGMGASQRSDDEIWAMIGIRWTKTTEGMPWNRVYVARFVALASTDGMWTFAGPAWEHELEDEKSGVRVLAGEHEEGIARSVLAAGPGIVGRTEDSLGVKLEESIVVKVYHELEDLQGSISPAYTDPLSGWNEPGESIKILASKGLEGVRLDTLLAHEVGHAVSFAMGEQMTDAPWWVLEGIAEVSADPFRENRGVRQRRIVQLYASGELRDWELLSDFHGEAPKHAMFVYLQGWSMVRYVGEGFGNESRNAWLTAMGAGETLDQATRSALGIPFGELDTRWRAMLASQVVKE